MNPNEIPTPMTDTLLKTGTNVEQLNEALERSRIIEQKLHLANQQVEELRKAIKEVLESSNTITEACQKLEQALYPH